MARRVVVIDDEAGLRKLLVDVLREEGLAVTPMATFKGLESIVDLAPDVIVLDYRLPGVDSGQALHDLRADPRTERIPIILCTADVKTVKQDPGRLADLRVWVLLKPFDLDDFIALIHEALAS